MNVSIIKPKSKLLTGINQIFFPHWLIKKETEMVIGKVAKQFFFKLKRVRRTQIGLSTGVVQWAGKKINLLTPLILEFSCNVRFDLKIALSDLGVILQ